MRIFLVAVIWLISNFSLANELELYTGNATGTYYSVGLELCKILKCEVKTSNGSIENIELLNDGGGKNLAIVQSDVLYDAYHGLGVFNDHQEKRAMPVVSLYTEAYALVVRENSKINSFRKLEGHIVNVGKTNSGSYHLTDKLLKLYNMSFSDFKYISYLNFDKQGKALCQGTIDAAIYAVGHPNQAILDTAKLCPIKIIPINDKISNTAMGYSLVKAKIPAGIYPNVNHEIATVGVFAVLVASEDLTSDYIYNMLKEITEQNKKLKLLHPALHDINKDINVPLHKGAEEFYKTMAKN